MLRKCKILSAIPKMLLMFGEVCVFISCMPAAAFISYSKKKKVGCKIAVQVLESSISLIVHEPSSEVALPCICFGWTYFFLYIITSLWPYIFEKHWEPDFLFVFHLVCFTEEYPHGRMGLAKCRRPGVGAYRGDSSSFRARRRWMYLPLGGLSFGGRVLWPVERGGFAKWQSYKRAEWIKTALSWFDKEEECYDEQEYG